METDICVRMPVQSWMCTEGVRKIFRALNHQRQGSTRFVGGCVRNALLGEMVNDIDIATVHTPEKVAELLKPIGFAVHDTGIDHGTVTVVAYGVPYEITTLRRDVSTDGRRATVAFTESWLEDAQRRDFHFNALYADASGNVFDPTGHGYSDLKARRVEFIGNAEDRITEDYLRILRFFRFTAWYASDRMSETALAACMRLRPGLKAISVERVWEELKKTLRAPDPRAALQAMDETGVLSVVLPEVQDRVLFNRVVEIEKGEGMRADPYIRLMSLCSKDAEVMRELAKRLKLSNRERKRLVCAAEDQTDFGEHLTDERFREIVYQVGQDTFRDRVRLAWAAFGDRANPVYWRALSRAADLYQRPDFPICGEDVIAVGINAGPQVGDVLQKTEAWWIENGFPKDVAQVARRMREIADETMASDGV